MNPTNASTGQNSAINAAPIRSPHPRPQKSHRGAWLLSLACLLTLALCVVFYPQIYLGVILPVNDSLRAANFTPDANTAASLDRLPLKKEAQRILEANHPRLMSREEFVDSGCNDLHSQASSLGCYDGNRIYVYDSQNEELDGLEESTMVHELLHSIWDHLSEKEQAELGDLLELTYQENLDQLEEHMKFYPREQFHTELHSVIGTELDPAKLPPALRQHYEKYFESPQRVYAFYNDSRETIDELRTRGQNLEASIKQLRQSIEREQAEYQQASTRLEGDIASFNNCASSGCFATREEFDNARRVLVDRQDVLRGQFSHIQSQIQLVNQQIEQYNKIALHQNSLIESIDSKASPKLAE